MNHLVIALIGVAAFAAAAPSLAQPVAACPAVPDFSRHGPEREAIEYTRAMGQAVNAREEASGLDRAADLAMLLLPDLAPDPASGCADAAPLSSSPIAACNAEARGALSVYLASAIPAEQLRDTWSFLLPRAGPIPAGDPAVALTGWRFTALSAGGVSLRYNLVTAPPYIDGRRERAWQYLMHHRSGEAVMSAVTQFVQSRLVNGRGEAVICPIASAAS